MPAPAVAASAPSMYSATPSTANPGSANGALGNASNAYDIAMQRLNKSLKLGQNTTSGEMTQAQQQLQQNQGRVQQGLINSGLNNTTVAQTMQQAPLQTYNQAIENIQNAGAKNQQQVLGQQSQTALQAAGMMQNALSQNQQEQWQGGMAQQQRLGLLPYVNMQNSNPGPVGF